MRFPAAVIVGCASFRNCASKPRLKSSSITSRAPLGPAGVRDLRFFLVLPSAIALITDNPRQRRPFGGGGRYFVVELIVASFPSRVIRT